MHLKPDSMASIVKHIKWLYTEFGIASVYETGSDAWLLILSRCVRMFAYGANSLIIALFFSALEFSDFYIGLFMSLTLAGDVLLSVLLTLVADKVGRRKILILGSLMMIVSGAVFALFENYWALLFAAVIGIISATGSDFGPFRAIEESTLSHLTTPKTRSDVLSWYITTASIGSALGTEFSGRAVEFFKAKEGWTIVDAYHKIFLAYVIGGILNMTFTLLLSKECEAEDKEPETAETEASEMMLDERGAPNNQGEDDEGFSPVPIQEPEKPKKQSRFAQISAETRWIMYKLWFLLIVDSLADGMVGYSLTTYYIDQKFHIAKSTLGDIISSSYILSSFSTIFAAPLAKRLGLINTMVFTHLPSSTAVLLFPTPNNLVLTVILFFIRTGLNNMDQAPRSAFIAAVVKSEERTAVMGITSMVRTLAATAGPSVTGILAGNNHFWIAFVAAGSLRICYDLGLWAMFVNMRLYQHEEKAEETKGVRTEERRRESDEEELQEL
ncbi:major facilitator superfamily domain-containing protein [Bisporella sp. PMI_857]|nr:major facilitator superfamily domain-containing protein [Bisporella sp. PMI_857]